MRLVYKGLAEIMNMPNLHTNLEAWRWRYKKEGIDQGKLEGGRTGFSERTSLSTWEYIVHLGCIGGRDLDPSHGATGNWNQDLIQGWDL